MKLTMVISTHVLGDLILYNDGADGAHDYDYAIVSDEVR